MFEINQDDVISVVIPSYGHAQFIESALSSVFNQTYSNVELIVLDDQSKDQTFFIASEWAQSSKVTNRFNNLIIRQNESNIGAYKTINRALSIATGRIIAILNSDDEYDPRRLEIMCNSMKEAGTGFAFSKVMPIDEAGRLANTYHLPVGLEDVFEYADKILRTMPLISLGFLQRNIAISTGNFLIHRDLLKLIGQFNSYRYVHDWDFALRAVSECEPTYIPIPLYKYRIHGSNSFKSLMHVGAIENEIIVRNFLDGIRNGRNRNKELSIYLRDPGNFFWNKVFRPILIRRPSL